MEKEEKTKSFDGRLLLVTTLLISICSIIYELMISSISTYLNGDSIKQFSITIGLYMSAMGVGSYLSKKVKTHLFRNFINFFVKKWYCFLFVVTWNNYTYFLHFTSV